MFRVAPEINLSPAVEFTSVPAWAVAPSRPAADVSGRYWTVVAFDDGRAGIGSAAGIVATWLDQLAARHPEARPRVHRVTEDDAAQRAVTADVGTALVGWRLMIAGPADACLRLRAHALGHGISDDEITVASTSVTQRDVHCVHCQSVTQTAVGPGGVVSCAGCGLDLGVHHHVSRRIGAHLGSMVDTAADGST